MRTLGYFTTMTIQSIKVGFIGTGNMALAMITSLLTTDCQPAQIYLNDIDQELLLKRQIELGVNITQRSADLFDTCDVIVLAVKPAQIPTICQQLPKNSTCLIISIAAGVKVVTIADMLGKQTAIIRLMPNTPVMLGVGAIGAYANQVTSDEQKQITAQILSSMGLSVWLEQEQKIDAITALSGSGPAYFFYFVEVITKQGVKLGLKDEDAYQLAVQTIKGASVMMDKLTHNVKQCQQLRTQVTSPNGTTQIAIETMDKLAVDKGLQSAMQAAFERAKFLANS